jgi:hypothetical protein
MTRTRKIVVWTATAAFLLGGSVVVLPSLISAGSADHPLQGTALAQTTGKPGVALGFLFLFAGLRAEIKSRCRRNQGDEGAQKHFNEAL